MTKRHLGVGIGATALSLTATAVGLVTASSSATAVAMHRSVHTTTFTSRTLQSISLDKTGHFVEFSKDIHHGNLIGADSTTGKYHAKTGKVTGVVSFLRKNGVIYGTFTLDTHTTKLVGKIDGGQGAYKDATGTLRGQAVNRKVSQVTITYHRQ